jgi:recombination protein RecR
MSVIDRVTDEFARLPGIGPKTALRLVYHLLRSGPEDSRRLASAIQTLAERVRPCGTCGNFGNDAHCGICSNPRRDTSTICVVEGSFDVGAVERTGRFGGVYHVLGGRLSPLDGIGPDQLNLRSLFERIRSARGAVKEVILATNPRVEGEVTAVYIERQLRPLGPKVTRLATGLPVGSDLEFVDGTTLAQALEERREM